LKLLLLPEWGKPLYPRLRARHPGERFVEAYSPADVLREIADADALFGYLTPEQLAAAGGLRWVQTPDAGMEGLFNRVPEIAETAIVVTNARGAGAPQIGEHALALMLHFARGLNEFGRLQRERRWELDYGLSIVQMIAGKTVGIVGFGKSGQEVGWRCKALGMSVVAADKHAVSGSPIVEQVWGLERLPELLAQSDYVVVTVPYTPENEGMIGARELAAMKPTARLIVTSRGRIVEKGALVAALRSGTIAGAGLDTVWPEPLPPEDELWELPNLVITPHIAGNSPELDERTFDILAENVGRYLAGQPLINVVDKRLRY
jgi:phosphoglycerate dehydrogenase-like enzyme